MENPVKIVILWIIIKKKKKKNPVKSNAKLNFQQPLLQSSVSHDPLKIIWICWFFYSIGAVLCLKASEEGGQLIQQGDGAVTGPRWGFVFCNGLYPLPEAHSVSAVAQIMSYPPGILSLSLSDVVG